jgi:hypothetical protein
MTPMLSMMCLIMLKRPRLNRVQRILRETHSWRQQRMLFNPSFNRLKHPTRMLNIPEDARVRGTVVETEIVEPVRVDFTSVRLPAGVVFIPPVGHGDVTVAHDCLPKEIKTMI